MVHPNTTKQPSEVVNTDTQKHFIFYPLLSNIENTNVVPKQMESVTSSSRLITIVACPLIGSLISLVFWLQVFLGVFTCPYLSRFNDKGKTKNLMVALFHDIAAFVLPLIVFCKQYTTFQIGGINTSSQLSTLNFSVGYFISDLVYWIKDGTHKKVWNEKTMLHHATCLVGIGSCWISGRGSSDLNYGMMLTHLNSPFGYIRYIAKQMGHENRRYAIVCEKMYTSTKLISILLISPPVVWGMVTNEHNSFIIKMCGLNIFVINLLWLRNAMSTKGKNRDYTV